MDLAKAIAPFTDMETLKYFGLSHPSDFWNW